MPWKKGAWLFLNFFKIKILKIKNFKVKLNFLPFSKIILKIFQKIMAINMSNKKALIGQILPEIEFNITANGLTISASERISTPRFVPFDHAGRCRECKGSEVELDFVVTKEGVTCYCTRIKTPTFIPFDTIHDLPGHCFFKVFIIKIKNYIF